MILFSLYEIKHNGTLLRLRNQLFLIHSQFEVFGFKHSKFDQRIESLINSLIKLRKYVVKKLELTSKKRHLVKNLSEIPNLRSLFLTI